MKRVFTALCAALCLCCTTARTTQAAATPASQAPATATPGVQFVQGDRDSGISEYKLKTNGLQILLAERHHTPIVSVMIVYHVGSRNEAVGYTGATHFLEHMMFRGTAKHDPLKGTGIDDVLKPIGGINNATTYYDRTSYFEVVPAQYLGTCLDLEADRMRGALLRESDQKSEMTVVRNELERDEDDPSRLMEVNEFAEAFMAHPYHHPVIGWRSDVENVPIARLRKFYDDFYYPNNATLVVIGDFQTAAALKQISNYFAPVKAAPRPFPKVYTSEPPQQGERRFTVKRGADLPKVMIGFHIPQATSKDTYALEVMSAILGDEKHQSSRLYDALIDTGLAADCDADNYTLHDPAIYTLLATATPGTKSEKLESILLEQSKKLTKEPVTDAELEKAKESVWKRMKLDAADPTGLSSQLAEAIAVADWRWWVNLEKNMRAVTAADITRVASEYFQDRNATVGYYYPAEKPATTKSAEATPPSESDRPETAVAQAKENDKPVSGEDGNRVTAAALITAADSTPDTTDIHVGAATEIATTGKAPSIAAQVRKKVLSNGMTVSVMPIPGSGVVSVSGKLLAGDYFHPPAVRSVTDFVADMLDKGSKHWSKEKLAQQLELMGTTLDFDSGNFYLEFESDVVREDLPNYMSILSDVLQSPAFPADELAKSKKQTLASLQAAKADTSQVATNAFYGALYKPDCVYYQKTFADQEAELQSVTTQSLFDFQKRQIIPANTFLSIVGDINPDDAFNLVARDFEHWHGGGRSTIDVKNCQQTKAHAQRINKPLLDKTDVEVIFGEPSPVYIQAPDFDAASIANAALGHDTISSRLSELRNKYGLTYGISSFFAENSQPYAPWLISYSVNPSNLDKSMPIVEKILKDYRLSGISRKELSDEANRLAGEYIIERMRSSHQLADAITRYEILGLGAKFMDEYPKRLQRITVPEVNAAIEKYFDPGKFVITVAGTIDGAKP